MERTLVKESENRALLEQLEVMAQTHALEVKSADGSSTVVLSAPRGRELFSAKRFLDELRTKPERRKGVASVNTLGSFSDLVNRSKDADSALFADDGGGEKPSLQCVLDYNQAGPDNTAARFGGHRVLYQFPISDEWKAWVQDFEDGEWLSQADFAAFLEDHIADVMEPADAGERVAAWAVLQGINLANPQRLLDLSRGLSVRVDGQVTQAQNLSTGEGLVHFAETHKDEGGAPLKIPGGFAISISVFKFDVPYKIPVRLRYRVSGAKLVWQIAVHRADHAFRDAFTQACVTAQAATELPIFYGTPEK